MDYLWIYDETPKRTMVHKVEEAISVFKSRFHSAPGVVVMNAADKAELDASGAMVLVNIRTDQTVRPNNFHVGY